MLLKVENKMVEHQNQTIHKGTSTLLTSESSSDRCGCWVTAQLSTATLAAKLQQNEKYSSLYINTSVMPGIQDKLLQCYIWVVTGFLIHHSNSNDPKLIHWTIIYF